MQLHPWVAEPPDALRFGVAGGTPDGWGGLRDFVQMAEGLGFDSYWCPDHPLLMSEPWSTLAAVATSTSRLRLGSMVSCVYYRNPVLLARTVADVDRLSSGRVVLGLGAGDMPHEFRAMGIPYPPLARRLAALRDVLEVVPPLLRGESVTYAGQYVQVEGAQLRVPAVQQPHVPIMVAGGGERTTLQLVARYADASNLTAAGWGGAAVTPADVGRKYDSLQEHCRAASRPPEAVLRSILFVPTLLAESAAALEAKRARVPPAVLQFLLQFGGPAALMGTPEQAAERLRPLVEAGCRYFIFSTTDADTLRLVAEQVMPALSSRTIA